MKLAREVDLVFFFGNFDDLIKRVKMAASFTRTREEQRYSSLQMSISCSYVGTTGTRSYSRRLIRLSSSGGRISRWSCGDRL